MPVMDKTDHEDGNRQVSNGVPFSKKVTRRGQERGFGGTESPFARRGGPHRPKLDLHPITRRATIQRRGPRLIAPLRDIGVPC